MKCRQGASNVIYNVMYMHAYRQQVTSFSIIYVQYVVASLHVNNKYVDNILYWSDLLVKRMSKKQQGVNSH